MAAGDTAAMAAVTAWAMAEWATADLVVRADSVAPASPVVPLRDLLGSGTWRWPVRTAGTASDLRSSIDLLSGTIAFIAGLRSSARASRTVPTTAASRPFGPHGAGAGPTSATEARAKIGRA